MKKVALVIVVVLLLLAMFAGCGKNKKADNTALVITEVNVSEITTTEATITWTTDEAAASQIEYGITANYGAITTLDANLVTTHRITLAGLIANTNYHYRVKSKDDAGNETISGDQTFTTTSLLVDDTPPVISNITYSDVTDTGATITWTTDKLATSNIEYGPTTSYGFSFPSPSDNTADKTSHSLVLNSLSPDTIYHHRVKSTDVSGNEAVSGDYNFTTSPISLPIAVLSGQPTGTVNYSIADIIVAGTDVVSYKYKLDSGSWSTGTPVSTHIILSNLADGLHTISVVGKNAAGNWQTAASSTTASWTVDNPTLSTPVIFPDAKLEAAIRLAIGKSQGDIYQADLVGLTMLSTNMQTGGITDLTGLEHCTSLTSLFLGNNQISNLLPLSSLTSLTVLLLHGNQIRDISPLSFLTNLTSLSLWTNQISDISPLSLLTSLTVLGLENNQISDIEPLVKNSGLGQGDSIYVTNNPLSTTSVNTYIPALKARGVTIYN